MKDNMVVRRMARKCILFALIMANNIDQFKFIYFGSGLWLAPDPTF